MKVSREQAAANRERVVDVAAALFREHGFDGVGLATLMRAAGLTHGGFYGQFRSKEALAAEAAARALAQSAEDWRSLTDGKNREVALASLLESYLSVRHRDAPGRGCAYAALAAEAARGPDPAVRRSFEEGLEPLISILGSLSPEEGEPERRRQALAAMAEMVGALVLARAVGDPAVSEEILDAAREDLVGRLGSDGAE